MHTPTQTSMCRSLNAKDNAPLIVAAATPHGKRATWFSTSLCLLSLCVLLLLLSFFCCFCCSAFVHQLSFRSCVHTEDASVSVHIFLLVQCTHIQTHTHIYLYTCVHTAEDAQFGRPRDHLSRRRLLIGIHLCPAELLYFFVFDVCTQVWQCFFVCYRDLIIYVMCFVNVCCVFV